MKRDEMASPEGHTCPVPHACPPEGHTCPERRYWVGTMWRAVPPLRYGTLRGARGCWVGTTWLHCYLVEAGVENLVVDPSSIEVNRRFRRATLALPAGHRDGVAGGARETDGMDVAKLLDQLMRAERGEKKVWHVGRVPGVEAEDRRQLHRLPLAVPDKPLLPRLEEVLAPSVVEVGRDALPPAQGSDAGLAMQPLRHDPNLILR